MSTQQPKHVALVPAAGSGQRFGADIPKQYSLLAGAPMLVHTVQALLAFEPLDVVWVIVSPLDDFAATVLARLLVAHPQVLCLTRDLQMTRGYGSTTLPALASRLRN
jgi:2-C-methyl-D-erythritol 4-phosphate cytidylyltransferase